MKTNLEKMDWGELLKKSRRSRDAMLYKVFYGKELN